jgi:hypothetical protein
MNREQLWNADRNCSQLKTDAAISQHLLYGTGLNYDRMECFRDCMLSYYDNIAMA